MRHKLELVSVMQILCAVLLVVVQSKHSVVVAGNLLLNEILKVTIYLRSTHW